MKKFLLIASALIAVAALSGCSNIDEAQSNGAPETIRFTASIGRYTKATDTSFEKGDKVGLYAGEPLNLVNIPLEYDNGALKSAQTLHWAEGQTGKVAFRAYYPYFEEMESQPEVVAFSVRKDQSKHEDFTNSDLMFASAEGSPSDESVNLVFNHLLSKLVLEIDNQSGDPVSQVLIGGPLRASLVNRVTGAVGAATVNPEESEEEVLYKPFLEQSGTRDQCSLILPPQKTDVVVAVFTASGRTVAFRAKQGEFVSGKMHKGVLTLNKIPVGDEVEFTLSVEDWANGGSIRFSDGELGVRTGWNIVYYASMGAKVERIQMEELAPGAFYGQIEDYRSFYYDYTNGYTPFADRFILVSEHDGYIVGPRMDTPQDMYELDEWPVSNGGMFCLSNYDGESQGPLGVWFYPDEGVVRFEPKAPKWNKLGTGEFVFTFYTWLPAYAKDCEVQIYEDETRPGVYKVMLPNELREDSDLHGPESFIVDARDPEKVILRPMLFFPNWEYYEMFYTAVPGNRGDSSNYGTLKNGIIRLGILDSKTRNDHTTDLNDNNAMQIVLPGYTREPVLGFNFYDRDAWATVDGQLCAVFWVRPSIDLEGLRYCIYPGYLEAATVRDEVLPAMISGEGNPVEFTPGNMAEIYIPIPESGEYTIAFFGEPQPEPSKYLFSYSYNYFELPDDSEADGTI